MLPLEMDAFLARTIPYVCSNCTRVTRRILPLLMVLLVTLLVGLVWVGVVDVSWL